MRYAIQEGSDSGHCCFKFTIIDTTNHESVCECFEIEDAQLICDALNKEFPNEPL